MNKVKIFSLLLAIGSTTLFALAYMSFQNSRNIEQISIDTTDIGHELLGLRDQILNYQPEQDRLHYTFTNRIIDIEKEAQLLPQTLKTMLWFPIDASFETTQENINAFEQQLYHTTGMLDMLIGVQVARKYALISLDALFKKTIADQTHRENHWYFLDFVNNNLSGEHIAHPQIQQFTQQLKLIDGRQEALYRDLLSEHNHHFIEKSEITLRNLANLKLSHALYYCVAAVGVLIGLIAFRGYQRFIHLQKINQEMKMASEKALKAAKAKSQFLATMSHELRTPMNGVLGIAQIINGETQEAATKNNIKVILESGQHLLTILNDILDYSKIEENKLVLESASFGLNQVIDPVVSAISPLAEEKNLPLNIDNRIPAHTHFIGDCARLRQILFNLAGNAIKFTEKGHVTLEFSLTSEEPQQLQIAVIDTGIGIDEHKHETIFLSFEQADSSTTRQFGGSGLGLAIVKKMTELMHGELTLTSRLGQGSRFQITLPLAIDQQRTQQHSQRQQECVQVNQVAVNQKSLKILLADDNRVNAIVAKGFCSKLGHHVDTAENGRIAIEMAQQNNYDLILMDNHMPEMNGIEATRYLREKLKLKTLIFAYTADVFREAHDDFIAAGADHVLTKPLQKESFHDALVNFNHRIEQHHQPSNVVQLHRENLEKLRLTEEELTNSAMLEELKIDPSVYSELVTSLINDFESYIDQLIAAFSVRNKQELHQTLHALKGVAFNLQLDNLGNLTQKIEHEVRAGNIPDVEQLQQLVNLLTVNVHQANRLLDKPTNEPSLTRKA
ncbi:hybrid sensor histidine kinase/response regulator [Vibrio taketomensis]|uniref:hybrid sensor histidine kinase/response regulator n=1 Tax=Vibrio taketomensis TaxID=2572923 RepID=UPI001389DCC4|nr:ATP-binding protein [Vibrio taketomensis]